MFISWNAKKKLLELTMAASDENALELDNLLDKEDSFNNLVNEITCQWKYIMSIIMNYWCLIAVVWLNFGKYSGYILYLLTWKLIFHCVNK